MILISGPGRLYVEVLLRDARRWNNPPGSSATLRAIPASNGLQAISCCQARSYRDAGGAGGGLRITPSLLTFISFNSYGSPSPRALALQITGPSATCPTNSRSDTNRVSEFRVRASLRSFEGRYERSQPFARSPSCRQSSSRSFFAAGGGDFSSTRC